MLRAVWSKQVNEMYSNTHGYSVVNYLIPCICIINLAQCVVLPEKHCFVDLLFIFGMIFVLEFEPYTGS